MILVIAAIIMVGAIACFASGLDGSDPHLCKPCPACDGEMHYVHGQELQPHGMILYQCGACGCRDRRGEPCGDCAGMY